MNLYKNSKLRKSFGENAKRRVENKFGVNKMVEQMEQFYREMYQKNCNGKQDLIADSTLSTKSKALPV